MTELLSAERFAEIRRKAISTIPGTWEGDIVDYVVTCEEVAGESWRLIKEIERLRAELNGDGLLTLQDQVDHAREEIARISAKYEDMTSIALWSARRLRHEQHKDFAYDAIVENLGREVERL